MLGGSVGKTVEMGNAVGLYCTKPDTTPNPNKDPSFDPNLGFPSGRKERGEGIL